MQSKRWTAFAAAALVAAAMWLGVPGGALEGGTALAAESNGSVPRTITVVGEGKIAVQPDVAYVRLGVSTRADTAHEAQTANANAFAAVEKVLKEQFNIAESDIKTDGFYVRPEYRYPERGGEPTVVGYTADHFVVVTYRRLDRLGELLDAVSAAGANQIAGIQFAAERADEYELQAIEKAMANARAKAEVIAQAANRSVLGVLSVQLQGAGSGPVIPYVRSQLSMGAADSAVTSVQPGELEIAVVLTVTFEM